MSDIAIRVNHLSKRYHIGRAQSHGDFLRSQRHDTLVPTFQRSNVPTFKRPKILGRVGSLLEVGTGSQSDPELILRLGFAKHPLGTGPARTSATRERRDALRGDAADRDLC